MPAAARSGSRAAADCLLGMQRFEQLRAVAAYRYEHPVTCSRCGGAGLLKTKEKLGLAQLLVGRQAHCA